MQDISIKKRMILETNEILKHMNQEMKNKIPEKVLKAFDVFSMCETGFAYDANKRLIDQDVLEETKDMVSYLYLKYCCDDEKKKMFFDKIHEEEAIAKEKEERKNWLLRDNQNEYVTKEVEESTALTKIEECNFFMKIIRKIKCFFKKN